MVAQLEAQVDRETADGAGEFDPATLPVGRRDRGRARALPPGRRRALRRRRAGSGGGRAGTGDGRRPPLGEAARGGVDCYRGRPMKVDGAIPGELARAADAARRAEAAGYDGAWTAETSHDAFMPLAIAAEHTERLELGTGIAVAFARNPMTTASVAWELQAFSKGRLLLGLGSQIKPHIEKRFSMPWSHPAPRMREFVLAMRAIWTSWQEGTKLDFRGEFYTHTLMTPFFDPGPHPTGRRRCSSPPSARG